MKKMFFAIALCLLGMMQTSAQTVVLGDMNNDGKVSVGDVAKVVATAKGDLPLQTINLVSSANAIDNSKITGTWRTKGGSEITFSADGKCSLGTGYTYEYHPFQGFVLIYDASGTLNKVYNLYRAENTYLILGEVGGTKAFEYYYSSSSFVSGITMSQTTATMNSGATLQLSATVTPAGAHDASLTWKSSSTSIATVDQTGKVIAKAAGTVTITATANDGSGKSATCKITVTQLVTKVALNYTTLSVGKGNNFNLTATITPTNASNKEVEWTSSNTSAVMVLDDGVFYAKAAGSSTITAKAKDGSGKKATCKVTVLSAAPTAITLSQTSVSIKPGETTQLTATVSPSGAAGVTLIWKSSDTSVATVDQTGKVTAKGAEGATATITATVAGSTSIVASATVKISNLLSGTFSVSATKKVQFTKANLYWDGISYKFEANQTDYPTEWDPNHVGHFYWTNLADYQSGNASYMPYAEVYSYSSQSTTDKFFCGEENSLTVEGTTGLFVLSQSEWKYLFSNRTNANNLCKYDVTVDGKHNCLIIAPDNFVGTLKSSYTLDEVNSQGLACLPADDTRSGTYIGPAENWGTYWTSTPSGNSPGYAYRPKFDSTQLYTNANGQRDYGRNIRLVRLAQ
ncbi:MAG: Ig-like domain-containing protein [Bacteroidaceae bacterium]|nr:Ig-like domain-containing protein [Bacteroidaceae bacterium]